MSWAVDECTSEKAFIEIIHTTFRLVASFGSGKKTHGLQLYLIFYLKI